MTWVDWALVVAIIVAVIVMIATVAGTSTHGHNGVDE